MQQVSRVKLVYHYIIRRRIDGFFVLRIHQSVCSQLKMNDIFCSAILNYNLTPATVKTTPPVVCLFAVSLKLLYLILSISPNKL